MSAVLVGTCISPVLGDREDDLKAAIDKNQSELADTQSSINSKQNTVNQLKTEIADLDNQLVYMLSSIDILKADIQSTVDQIDQKTVELGEAEEDRDEQYKAMTRRIQYIYENGGTDSWMSFLLKADTLSELLNRADYTKQLEKCDREMLNKFVDCINDVAEKRANLQVVKAELDEEEKALEEQQKELETLLEEKKATSANYSAELNDLRAKADSLTDEIYAQNQEIARIQEEKAAEEARRLAEEEAARKEAEEEAKRREEEQNRQPETPAPPMQSTPPTPEVPRDDSSYSGTGVSVADYACQWVGVTPYVWGGESLITGADCSGFVMCVFAQFGVGLPHSSAALAGVGVGVPFSEARPGDLICYSGHVAIYIGNNTVVHASNAAEGTKITTPANYRTVVAVRRVI